MKVAQTGSLLMEGNGHHYISGLCLGLGPIFMEK
jgi:hypothetical protein